MNTRMKKLLSLSFVTVLLLSMTMVAVRGSDWDNVVDDPHAANAVWVDPNSYTTSPELDTLKTCDTFTIDALINISLPLSPGATGMFGWQYILFWNSDNINLTDYQTHIPPNWAPPNGSLVADEVGVWDSAAHGGDFPEEDGRDYHMYAYSCTKGPPFLGVISLCTYEFHVIETVYEPSPDEIDTLRLKWVKFMDDKAKVIPMTIDSGEYRKCAQPIPYPEIRVVPRKTNGVCGQKFNISISIYNLYPGWNLWGWEVKLKYDPAYVTALNSYEGPFLPSFLWANGSAGTTYINNVTYAPDTILTAGSFNDPNHTAPHSEGANGIVSILEFNASVQTIAPTIVVTAFGLFDTKLAGVYDTTVQPITHTVRNGTYNVPYKVVGWFMDCYTDAARKKVIGGKTNYIGLGINQTADSYETQDLVILHAYLEYNFQPECNKIVMFEIYSQDKGISIIRTALTNCSGVATIEFTIPNIPSAFGHWTCYQAAQVKIYQKPSDWLYFKVGWIIEIWNVTVTPFQAKKCDIVTIKVDYKTISFMPCKVLFTVIILDELLDPICEYTWWELYVEPTEPVLCSERNDTTYGYCHIPCFAHAGKATVYVNAFTDFPMKCGCPYCPEKTAEFWIIASACPP